MPKQQQQQQQQTNKNELNDVAHYEQNDLPEPLKFLVEPKSPFRYGLVIEYQSKVRQCKHLAHEWFAKGGLDVSQKGIKPFLKCYGIF